MSIALGGLIAFAFRGANLLIAFGLVWLTSDQLGGAGRGTFVLGATVVGVVTAVAGGITTAAAYQVSNQGRAPVAVLVNAAIPSVALAAGTVLAGVALWQTASGDAASIAIPVAAAAAAVILTAATSGVLLGEEAFVRYNLSLVTPPLAALAAISATFLAIDEPTARDALAAFAAGQWAALPLLLLAVLWRAERTFPPIQATLVRSLSTFGFMAAVSGTIAYLNYRGDLFIVEHFEGRMGVGVYGNAVYLAEAVWHASGSLALAMFARVGSLDAAGAALLTARVMRHTLLVLSAVCLGLFVVAGLLVDVFFAGDFDGMTGALRILLPGTLVYGLGAALSGFFTYQQGRPWMAAIIAGSALLTDLGLAFVLVPSMGINGAALATTLSYCAAMVLALALFTRSSGLGPVETFRFGRQDLDDYRRLAARLRSMMT